MTTAGFLSSWTTNKAAYFMYYDVNGDKRFGKLVFRDQASYLSLIEDFARPAGANNNYAGWFTTHQLKFYSNSYTPAAGVKNYWVKQGDNGLYQFATAIANTSTQLWANYRTPYGVFIKDLAGSLYVLQEDTGLAYQTIPPANLGSGSPGTGQDYRSDPCYFGGPANWFAYVAANNRVYVYSPGDGTEMRAITVTNGNPSSINYNPSDLVYSYKWNRVYFVATVGGPISYRVNYYTPTPAGTVTTITTTNVMATQSGALIIYNGDPIYLGNDNIIYRSFDGGPTWSAWINAGAICNLEYGRYLATDGRNIFISGTEFITSEFKIWQIDINLAARVIPQMNGYNAYEGHYTQLGAIVP
jgi:hypothetical protein